MDGGWWGTGVVSPTPDDGRIPMEAALHAEAIRHALSEVASSSQASRSQQSGWTSGDDEFDEMEEEGGSHLSSTALVGS
jgi:protein phosphatase inhibitor 2